MRRAWVVVCLLVPVAGCVDQNTGGGPGIPGPPKLVVNHGPDNLTEVYVHASVGEVNYTQITLRVNNASTGEPGFHQSNQSYALDVKLDATTFHANVTVQDEDTVYAFEALMMVNTTGPGASMQLVPTGDDLVEVELPYSTTLDPWRELT